MTTTDPRRQAADYVAALSDTEVQEFITEARNANDTATDKGRVAAGRSLYQTTHRRNDHA